MERRAILSLVATGRITAVEAERLLRAWNEGREWIWLAIICSFICMAQMQGHLHAGAIWHVAHGLVTAALQEWHQAAMAVFKGMGGRA